MELIHNFEYTHKVIYVEGDSIIFEAENMYFELVYFNFLKKKTDNF